MIINFFYRIIKPILFKLDPEKSHDWIFYFLSRFELLVGKFFVVPSPPLVKPTYVRKLFFNNRIGLAAGLDKNGEYIDSLSRFGFGSIEVGTVTPMAQPGNKKPRLFRIQNERALINRLGFNNAGMHQVFKNLKKSRWVKEKKGVLGINLGINKTTSLNNAFTDYQKGLLFFWDIANYFVINISSPNTKQVRALQTDRYLEDLVKKISRFQKQQNEKMGTQKPVLYKISPDNTEMDLEKISDVFNYFSVDGVIVTNTTNNHDELNSDLKVPGGLSGAPLEQRALLCLKKIRPLLNRDITIIASGGIMSKEAVEQRIKAGASLVQIYTGLIYEGPKIVSDSLEIL
ncbi:quinone-dependent dihydroorotate dehydrogenase [Betaproteobacteria bacterium]|nr:quinone-dependent dihydroorotate dehydrogenase [Betaproteobacteria bacterium]